MKKKILLIVSVISAIIMLSVPAYADEVTGYTDLVDAYDGAQAPKERLVFAADSEMLSKNGELINMGVRPFVEHDRSYVPFRYLIEQLGGVVDYDAVTRTATGTYKDRNVSISIDSPSIRVYDDWTFYPIREVCDKLGVSINWYGGVFCIADGDATLTDAEVEEYKQLLNYQGYVDSYFQPRHVVNPYVTYSYDQMNEDINTLSRMYPDIVHSVRSIGKSVEGRDITCFTLGKGSENIVICASMHAREYIATNVLMNMVDTYALSYAWDESRDGYNFRDALNKYSFQIIPMVNPDGINLAQYGYDSTQNPDYLRSLNTNSYGSRGWKANINGVDLNNNFDWLWYSKGGGPSYAGYSGPYGDSEPETEAMQSFICGTDFKIFLSLHTQGQVVYWMDPNCDQSLYNKHKPHVDRICSEIGFEEMPSDGSIGYSGYMTDYIRKYTGKMAMTIELCPYIGDYPYPESDFDRVYYPVRNIGLILADIAQYL